jgi:ankyrin repeat protein
MKVAADIEARLGHLPDTLEKSYWDIFTQIEASGENAAQLARTTFQWLLCAQASIDINQFAKLASASSESIETFFTATEVRDVCANLITSISGEEKKGYLGNEESTNFGFAHLSVREFLEGLSKRGVDHFRPDVANAAIASLCLSYLSAVLKKPITKTKKLSAPDAKDYVEEYTVKYWPNHVAASELLKEKPPLDSQVMAFLVEGENIAPTYNRWCEKKESAGQIPPHNLIWFVHNSKIMDIEKIIIAEEILREERRGAFVYAAKVGDLAAMELLVRQGVDIESVGGEASTKASYEALKYLLDNEAPVLANSLYWAISNDSWDKVGILLEKNLLRDSKIFGQYELSKALTLAVSNGASALNMRPFIQQQITKEAIAVVRTLSKGLRQSANRLIDFGYNVQGSSMLDGRTALHWAAQWGFQDTALMIVERGGAVNAQDEHSDTPLHLATNQGHQDVVSLLLNKGADVSKRNTLGRTPIHCAALMNRPEILKILREHGSDDVLVDHSGWTPLQLAQMYQHADIVNILEPPGIDIEKGKEAATYSSSQQIPEGVESTTEYGEFIDELSPTTESDRYVAPNSLPKIMVSTQTLTLTLTQATPPRSPVLEPIDS